MRRACEVGRAVQARRSVQELGLAQDGGVRRARQLGTSYGSFGSDPARGAGQCCLAEEPGTGGTRESPSRGRACLKALTSCDIVSCLWLLEPVPLQTA